MINLNRIRSLKTLAEMKTDLSDFLASPDMLQLYVEDLKWGQEDYEADREQVTDLLEQVNRRIASLERFEKKTQGVGTNNPSPQI